MQPSQHNTVKNFAPLQRELVFDIDMDAYDDIRTCCKGAKLCSRCWSFINVAVKVLDVALKEDFGYQHVVFIYSGRRGMHCWVCDESARKLDNPSRAALAEYLAAALTQGSSHGGNKDSEDGAAVAMDKNALAIQRTANHLTVPMHPSFM
jgi:DNA primase small subunit